MNKYKEALNHLVKVPCSNDYSNQSNKGYKEEKLKFFNGIRVFEDDEKALSILQELVDKETPKKPLEFSSNITNSEDVYTFNACPNCRKYLYVSQKYCDVCGQALDWSEE